MNSHPTIHFNESVSERIESLVCRAAASRSKVIAFDELEMSRILKKLDDVLRGARENSDVVCHSLRTQLAELSSDLAPIVKDDFETEREFEKRQQSRLTEIKQRQLSLKDLRETADSILVAAQREAYVEVEKRFAFEVYVKPGSVFFLPKRFNADLEIYLGGQFEWTNTSEQVVYSLMQRVYQRRDYARKMKDVTHVDSHAYLAPVAYPNPEARLEWNLTYAIPHHNHYELRTHEDLFFERLEKWLGSQTPTCEESDREYNSLEELLTIYSACRVRPHEYSPSFWLKCVSDLSALGIRGIETVSDGGRNWNRDYWKCDVGFPSQLSLAVEDSESKEKKVGNRLPIIQIGNDEEKQLTHVTLSTASSHAPKPDSLSVLNPSLRWGDTGLAIEERDNGVLGKQKRIVLFSLFKGMYRSFFSPDNESRTFELPNLTVQTKHYHLDKLLDSRKEFKKFESQMLEVRNTLSQQISLLKRLPNATPAQEPKPMEFEIRWIAPLDYDAVLIRIGYRAQTCSFTVSNDEWIIIEFNYKGREAEPDSQVVVLSYLSKLSYALINDMKVFFLCSSNLQVFPKSTLGTSVRIPAKIELFTCEYDSNIHGFKILGETDLALVTAATTDPSPKTLLRWLDTKHLLIVGGCEIRGFLPDELIIEGSQTSGSVFVAGSQDSGARCFAPVIFRPDGKPDQLSTGIVREVIAEDTIAEIKKVELPGRNAIASFFYWRQTGDYSYQGEYHIINASAFHTLKSRDDAEQELTAISDSIRKAVRTSARLALDLPNALRDSLRTKQEELEKLLGETSKSEESNRFTQLSKWEKLSHEKIDALREFESVCQNVLNLLRQIESAISQFGGHTKYVPERTHKLLNKLRAIKQTLSSDAKSPKLVADIAGELHRSLEEYHDWLIEHSHCTVCGRKLFLPRWVSRSTQCWSH